MGAAPARAVRIVLLNANCLFATALNARVAQDPRFEIVGLASDATEAATLVETLRPDVVLIDAAVPDNLALATRAIARHDAAARVVIMTSADDEFDAVEAHHAGASAFVQKPRSLGGLLETLEVAAILAPVRLSQPELDTA